MMLRIKVKKTIKIIFKFRFTKYLFRKFFSLFYDERYLKGRLFDEGIIGYYWCLKGILYQKILRFNSHVPWPITPFSRVSNPYNIIFDPDDLNNFQSPGCYFQCFKAKIYIGKRTYIAPNVGIITANHNIYKLDEHDEGKDVIIGKNCWIGMNSVILPGVILGNRTIVGAGSVVTKSFPEGNVIIAGVPAKVIKKI
jgi:hypothetical protein